MPDPFGRALLDHYRGERTEPLYQHDGEMVYEHPLEDFYFGEFDAESHQGEWLEGWLHGPLVDLGAGAGRESLHFQERFETVAVEVSDALVTLLSERGVEDARRGDMFALRESFDRDRFRSAVALGTQICLAGSMRGLREFLGDLAHVTTADATAIVDAYDPDYEGADGMLGFRDDPTPGLAHRVMHFEYEGEVGDTLCMRLFGPDRLREACSGTGWRVAEVRRPHDSYHYRAALEKR